MQNKRSREANDVVIVCKKLDRSEAEMFSIDVYESFESELYGTSYHTIRTQSFRTQTLR
jgi:hypothetical protein